MPAGFEETGDPELLLKGFAGIMAVTANLLPDGMGFGYYVSTPGIQAFDPPRTLDNGIGMQGDPHGFGCDDAGVAPADSRQDCD